MKVSVSIGSQRDPDAIDTVEVLREVVGLDLTEFALRLVFLESFRDMSIPRRFIAAVYVEPDDA